MKYNDGKIITIFQYVCTVMSTTTLQKLKLKFNLYMEK